jgi:hypothetical protein
MEIPIEGRILPFPFPHEISFEIAAPRSASVYARRKCRAIDVCKKGSHTMARSSDLPTRRSKCRFFMQMYPDEPLNQKVFFFGTPIA